MYYMELRTLKHTLTILTCIIVFINEYLSKLNFMHKPNFTFTT